METCRVKSSSHAVMRNAPVFARSGVVPFAPRLLTVAAVAACSGTSVFAAPTCDPVAQISPATQTVLETNTSVTLNGKSSKDESFYLWEQTSGPAVTLSSTTDGQPTFSAPAVGPDGATLTFKLTVTGCNPAKTSSAQTTINVTNVHENQPPLAAASASPAMIFTGDQVMLDASSSSDPDGDVLSYLWEQISGPVVVLSGANTQNASFTAPAAPYPNGASLKFKLTVSDGTLSGSTEAIVNVLWQNMPPVAQVACPASVDEGSNFTLQGDEFEGQPLSTDPDDGIASYQWIQADGGPVATLPADMTTAAITAKAPLLNSPLDTMLFKLEVKDAGGLAASAECNVVVNDITAPLAAPTQSPESNAAGWNNTDVTVDWHWADAGKGIDSNECTTTSTSADEGAPLTLNATCKDIVGNSGSASYNVNVDKTKPLISAAATTAPNANGWYKGDVTVQFTCFDGLSGLAVGCPVDQVLNGEGNSVSSTAQSVADKAGNISELSNVITVSIDKSAPGITWNGGIANGDTFFWGSVPAVPTCTATDGLSGPASCSVSGYSTALGTHTLTAVAYDKAGNQTTETRSYSVNAWTLNGFYQPVDMNGVVNTVKNGATVPLKFEVFAGNELTSVATTVKGFSVKQVSCSTSAPIDDIELTTTGSTSLRYDTTAGQFIQNWQTPKVVGACYVVTMTTQDGSSISANFKLK